MILLNLSLYEQSLRQSRSTRFSEINENFQKQGSDLIELRLTNWKGGGVFGSPEYTWMGFLDDLKHLIELELRENIPILELRENIRILDVLTKLGFWPFWPLQWP